MVKFAFWIFIAEPMRNFLFVFTAGVMLLFASCKKDDPPRASIEYPASGVYGPNILDTTKTVYPASDISLAANLANGAELKIKISKSGDGEWFYVLGTVQNWVISGYDPVTKSQTYTAFEAGRNCDLLMEFRPGQYRIEYFELGSGQPGREKMVEVQN